MKVTLKERRFLIVWTCINIFALIVNITPIRGKIRNAEESNTLIHDRVVLDSYKPGFYIWTSGEDKIFFWPFTKFFDKEISRVPSGNENYGFLTSKSRLKNFQGIFNGYDFSEFIIYSILGFAIIFVPKLWSPQSIKPKND